MASDSCWTGEGDVQEVSAIKIRRLPSGALLGFSGANDAREMEELLAKVKTPKQLPSRATLAAIRADHGGILVLPGGRVFKVCTSLKENCKDSEVGVWEVNRGFATTGSGCDIALGAMAAGKSAREAVAIACKYDINSRLPVHSLELLPVKRR
jgi:ATP-dependent protease HslVU (ClpYQ) peptidase subunit